MPSVAKKEGEPENRVASLESASWKLRDVLLDVEIALERTTHKEALERYLASNARLVELIKRRRGQK